jgi:ketosteroid isomerase-like protein
VRYFIAAIVIALPAVAAPAQVHSEPKRFASTGSDRAAIGALLRTYTIAVSTKNQALFESLLLDRSIPFSGVPLAGKSNDPETRNYEGFRKAVFEGKPFKQRFRDVQVEQDGDLADVRLVFENSSAEGRSWGWKTLQLLRAGGRWKIASEFYTGHSGRQPFGAVTSRSAARTNR